MSFLTNLPYPTVIEKLDYDDIKNEIIELFAERTADYELLESDPYSAIIEAIAYREMLLRARINDSVLSMLIPYAAGSDLDNIVALYGVERLKGEKPAAPATFTLSTPLAYDVTIPQNALFRSDKGDISRLTDNVKIEAGELTAEGTLELDEYVKTSEVKTELIQTPQPFVFQITQTDIFKNGTGIESDEAFRERAILSLSRFSTAGSAEAYKYWAKTINTKVEEVFISAQHDAGVVNLYLKTFDDDDITSEVSAKITGEKVRPLTDLVVVNMSVKKTLSVTAVIELFDLNRQKEIDDKIKSTKTRFDLGEDINLSYLYKTLHQEGVYRVTITIPEENIITADNEFYEITAWDLTYEAAAW
ncbi:MAG: baseplate J/gp47 family protein [Campylobacteraceae bacterium]|jgi:phage-related baseplate assembly protein|nr:baseplate J/gp47 family protein [Campylobacteraceae bacterium]